MTSSSSRGKLHQAEPLRCCLQAGAQTGAVTRAQRVLALLAAAAAASGHPSQPCAFMPGAALGPGTATQRHSGKLPEAAHGGAVSTPRSFCITPAPPSCSCLPETLNIPSWTHRDHQVQLLALYRTSPSCSLGCSYHLGVILKSPNKARALPGRLNPGGGEGGCCCWLFPVVLVDQGVGTERSFIDVLLCFKQYPRELKF